MSLIRNKTQNHFNKENMLSSILVNDALKIQNAKMFLNKNFLSMNDAVKSIKSKMQKCFCGSF